MARTAAKDERHTGEVEAQQYVLRAAANLSHVLQRSLTQILSRHPGGKPFVLIRWTPESVIAQAAVHMPLVMFERSVAHSLQRSLCNRRKLARIKVFVDSAYLTAVGYRHDHSGRSGKWDPIWPLAPYRVLLNEPAGNGVPADVLVSEVAPMTDHEGQRLKVRFQILLTSSKLCQIVTCGV